MFYERLTTSLPEVGSRVCRGPDWQWHDQDGGSTGTIIGHDTQGILIVLLHTDLTLQEKMPVLLKTYFR